jgi:hypothetical protein
MLKSAALAMALVIAGVSSSAFAADKEAAPEKAPTAQQSKMGDCAKKNKGKTGDDYKAGVKACLSAKAEGAEGDASKTQQGKMKKCAAENKGKKGAEYKDAMKACLKG